jgi:polyphosphate glucokinase
LTAANVDNKWIDFPAGELIAQKTGCQVSVGNDADVAGFAEMRFGAGQGVKGTVMIFTLGTGIGCTMFVNNQIVPNLELGHIYTRNQKKDAEHHASDRARKRDELNWREWGKRLSDYFGYIEDLFWPDLIILGGGVSKKHKKFLPYVKVRAKVVPAQLLNEAGIIGAAIMAETAAAG